MKYFTADLYERFNSRDVDVADRADDQWKKAEARYEARLERIRGGLPEAVRELADNLCLHDAEVMAIGEDAGRERRGEATRQAVLAVVWLDLEGRIQRAKTLLGVFRRARVLALR